MAKNIVTVEFKGDSASLTQAISKLDEATKKLLNTQSKIRDFNDRIVKSNNSNKNSLKNLRVQLQLKNKSLKDLNIPLKTYKEALGGSRLAIARIRQATKKHIKDLKRQRKGILETEHGTRILGGSFAVLRSKMLLASFGAGLFGASIGRLTKLYGEQEQAEKKLETALGRRSNALMAFASAQQKVTAFGDEETLVAMSLVGAYTDNEKAIARITKASMDLASAKGMDLNSAIDLVSKSIFSSTNAMSRYGIEIKGTQGTVERLESATENISQLYGGQAFAQAETFNGAMIQMRNAVGDTGEVLGSIFAPAVLLGARSIQSFAESISIKKIKEFSTALGIVSTGFVIYKSKAIIASIATLRFGKALKLSGIGLAVAGLTIVIDKLGIFNADAEALLETLKELNGEIGDIGGNKAIKARILSQERELFILGEKLRFQKDGISVSEEQKLLRLEEQKTFEDAENNLISDFEKRKKILNLKMQEIKLEDDFKNAKLQSASAITGALSGLNTVAQGNAKISKALAITQAVIDTYAGANKAFAQGGVLGFVTGSAIIAQGLANVAQMESQKLSTFEQGGLVGGRRHSQGGTMIEAEQGEFVMSRSAVESIGVEAMNQINQGSGTGITLNISAPLVDETVVEAIIPAIQRAQRMNLA
tara:strand:+ start:4183 stop:6135 length:1953 start_codon:yes stop_codon:yes gene_type:complete